MTTKSSLTGDNLRAMIEAAARSGLSSWSGRMDRPVVIVGAPTSIGIKPYDTGAPRGLDQAPATLRRLGLAARLRAEDVGDVLPLPYRDFIRPPAHPRNEAEVLSYSVALAER